MLVSAALSALLELVMPSDCAGCSRGTGGCCPACRAELSGLRRPAGSPPVPMAYPMPGAPPVFAGAPFRGALRHLVTAHKDRERRDLRPILGELLLAACLDALQWPRTGPPAGPGLALGARTGPVLLVPVPTTAAARRRRGDDPLRALSADCAAALATAGWPVVWTPVLAARGRAADQAGLSRSERIANRQGATIVPVRYLPLLHRSRCLIVDDVVTTGATLAEAARALRQAGAGPVVAATVAATPGRGFVAAEQDPRLLGA